MTETNYTLPVLPGVEVTLDLNLREYKKDPKTRFSVKFGIPKGTEITAARSGIVSLFSDTETAGVSEEAGVVAVGSGIVSRLSEYSEIAGVLGLASNSSVVIDHGDQTAAIYRPLEEIAVENGQNVQQGDKIGTVMTDEYGFSQLSFNSVKLFGKHIISLPVYDSISDMLDRRYNKVRNEPSADKSDRFRKAFSSAYKAAGFHRIDVSLPESGALYQKDTGVGTAFILRRGSFRKGTGSLTYFKVPTREAGDFVRQYINVEQGSYMFKAIGKSRALRRVKKRMVEYHPVFNEDAIEELINQITSTKDIIIIGQENETL